VDGTLPAGGYAARRARQAQCAAKRAKRESESGDGLGDEFASDSEDEEEEGSDEGEQVVGRVWAWEAAAECPAVRASLAN
jgi:hypothetical protein